LYDLFDLRETNLLSIGVQLDDALQVPVGKQVGMPIDLRTYYDGVITALKLLQGRKLEPKHPLVLGGDFHGYVSSHRNPTITKRLTLTRSYLHHFLNATERHAA
jgi:hypothetical protein